MKTADIRELSDEELNNLIDETRKTKVELRFAHALRKLESPAKLRQEKKKLAQLLTIQHEKKLKAAKAATPEKASK